MKNCLFKPLTIFILTCCLIPFYSYSKSKTFTREYTYNASEADSKISARSIALSQVKQLLLEELGSYIHSNFKVANHESSNHFSEMSSLQIKSITASVTQTKIIDEKWDGEQYYLKANIKVDEDDLKRKIDEIAKDQQKLETLEALQRKTDSAFAEIERLRAKLTLTTSQSEKEELQKRYERMAAQFSDMDPMIDRPRMEVVFVLDATGSMGSMINNAKDKIWAIATTMAQSEPAPELSIGVIAYRDKTDKFITKQLPLTDNIDELYAQLLTIGASGGGDMPESVNQGLSEAVFDFQWDTSPSTLRTIYLIGDCPPHMDYVNDIKYPKSIKEAIRKDIIINTIQCGNNQQTKSVWQEIAQNANGEYLSLNQSGNTFAVTTSYDEEIARKAKELDKTRMYYGKNANKKTDKRKNLSEDINTQSTSTVSARRAVYNVTTESGKKNFLGENELLDAFENDDVELEEIEDENLPEELQGLSNEEQKRFLNEQIKKRKELEAEIKELDEKRSKEIEVQLKNRDKEAVNSFNYKLHSTFSKQAEKKNYKAPKDAKF